MLDQFLIKNFFAIKILKAKIYEKGITHHKNLQKNNQVMFFTLHSKRLTRSCLEESKPIKALIQQTIQIRFKILKVI